MLMILRNGVKSGWVIHRQIKMTGSHTEAALSRLTRDYTLRQGNGTVMREMLPLSGEQRSRYKGKGK